ncbi:spore germination protein [Salinithrix halophila]|uniref:Spore germination protein n=1 Tax=Salinithrix halophila TaxID=1485204 RepID=A0ABV8JI50_9BACL
MSALKKDLPDNIKKIQNDFGDSSDLKIRQLRLGGREPSRKLAVIYLEGLIDENRLQDFILQSQQRADHSKMDCDLLERIKNELLAVGEVQSVVDFPSVYQSVVSGNTVILIEGFMEGVALSVEGSEGRSVSKPSTETVIRGPQEAFNENLRTNTALVRQIIRTPDLWMETRQVGKITKTDIAIMYIQGIVNEHALEEVHERMDRIDIDAVLESGYIEEMIQDANFSFFPTIDNTERPDVVAASLLEGRIAIFVNGTPFVLMVPALFAQFLQSPEDYYTRSDFGLIRILRYIAVSISFLAPSLYIAITTFHQEMLQTTLLISIAAQREAIPFPALVEALIMEFTFEVLREAGIRMPRAVGSTISIVGAIVLGEAAVQAGLVSPAMVIIVSITAIAGFVYPSIAMGFPFRVLRFALMGLAASFGLFGIFIGLMMLVLHLCSLRSFGVPYMSPMAPMNAAGMKDSLFRFPLWSLHTRPRLISRRNVVRERSSNSVKPKPRP